MTAVIASSKAKPLAEQWKGEITSYRHQYFCDEPEKLEGHDQVLHLMICLPEVWQHVHLLL